MTNNKWMLGKTKTASPDNSEWVYLEDFKWECGWYWSGGIITGEHFTSHFDHLFLKEMTGRRHILGSQFVTPWEKVADENKDKVVIIQNGCAIWEDLSTFLNYSQYDSQTWWRIKDLFVQFYALKKAAEVCQCGGNCTSVGRTPGEISKEVADKINKHIENVIIPALRDTLDKHI